MDFFEESNFWPDMTVSLETRGEDEEGKKQLKIDEKNFIIKKLKLDEENTIVCPNILLLSNLVVDL